MDDQNDRKRRAVSMDELLRRMPYIKIDMIDESARLASRIISIRMLIVGDERRGERYRKDRETECGAERMMLVRQAEMLPAEIAIREIMILVETALKKAIDVLASEETPAEKSVKLLSSDRKPPEE